MMKASRSKQVSDAGHGEGGVQADHWGLQGTVPGGAAAENRTRMATGMGHWRSLGQDDFKAVPWLTADLGERAGEKRLRLDWSNCKNI